MRPSLALSCLLILLAAALSGCATKRPVLYPNAKYEAVGSEGASLDIAQCMQLAEQHVGNEGAASKTAKSTAAGAAGGAAVGAVVGAIVGNPARGAAVGAGGGGTQGAIGGIGRARDPDPIYKNFVGRCLRERGYDVIGWR